MQKYFKLLFVSLAIAIFSGCSFGNFTKKTEINLQNKEEVQKQEDVVASENVSEVEKPEQTDASQSTEIVEPPKAEVSVGTTKENITSKNDAVSEMPSPSTTLKITNRLVSWGFSASSGRTIDTIIIHSSYNAIGSDEHDLDDIINKEYKPAGVSPHYIIARDGKIYQLVADKNIAYHAGVSKMPDGRDGVNNFSIGIEIVETKSESPNSAQYSALKSLINHLKGEYKIKYVLGHSDIASGRKDDPWNFDWSKIK